MNKNTFHKVILVSLFVSISTIPLSPIRAYYQDYNSGTDFQNGFSVWCHGDSEFEDSIDDLDSDAVEDMPIPVLLGVEVKNLTKNFGEPRGDHYHEGLDIMSPEGTPVVSPTDAVVIHMGDGDSSGLYVTTAAPGDESFVYMHLSEIADIDVGDVLKPGDLIGYVGHTGNAVASSPHLHFEIHDEDGTAIDPYPRLTEVFDLEDKIQYSSEILDDADDEDGLAEFLVTKFRSTFTSTESQDIDLPQSIQDALEDIPVSTYTSTSTSTNLRIGSKGTEVVSLQEYLLEQDIGTADKIIADGIFGPITHQALVDFQKSVGLDADGIYGPKSKAYVLAHP